MYIFILYLLFIICTLIICLFYVLKYRNTYLGVWVFPFSPEILPNPHQHWATAHFQFP